MGKETLTYYVQIFRYHKRIFFFFFSLSLFFSIIGSFFLPRRYRSQCTIMLEVKSIENPLAQNRETPTDPEQLKTIRNLILSNNRLSRVIRRLGLDQPGRKPLEPPEIEGLISQIRENMVIDTIGTGLFTITYTGEEPYRVQDITNTLANMFIEESLELTGSQAQAEYNFIQKQLREYKERLENSEQALKEFKEKNIGQLPGEANTTITHLQKLQDELLEMRLKGRELEQKRAILKKQLAEEKPSIVAFVQRENRIRQLQLQLADLLSRYTENYPDVIKLKAELEKERCRDLAPCQRANGQPGQPPAEDHDPLTETSIINPLYQKIKESLNTIEIEINLLQTRQQDLEKDMEVYAGRVTSIPAQEEELARLTRDRKVNEEAYEMLLKRLAQIHMVREMEKSAHQSRFKILDPARLPMRPTACNPWQITLICIFLSLGAGLGAMVGFEYLGRTIKDESDIQENLHLPVVAAIPRVLTREEKRQRNRYQALEGLVLIFWIILILSSLMRNVFQ